MLRCDRRTQCNIISAVADILERHRSLTSGAFKTLQVGLDLVCDVDGANFADEVKYVLCEDEYHELEALVAQNVHWHSLRGRCADGRLVLSKCEGEKLTLREKVDAADRVRVSKTEVLQGQEPDEAREADE